jgi:hypothetical protein
MLYKHLATAQDVQMPTTSLWVPLVVAAVGVLGTLSAAIFTQVWTSHREEARRRQDREVEEQRRLRAERQKVYVEMLVSSQRWHDEIVKAWGIGNGGVEVDDAMTDRLGEREKAFGQSFSELTLVGSPEVLGRASEFGLHLLGIRNDLGKGKEQPYPGGGEAQLLSTKMLNAMREDLSIPGGVVGMKNVSFEP